MLRLATIAWGVLRRELPLSLSFWKHLAFGNYFAHSTKLYISSLAGLLENLQIGQNLVIWNFVQANARIGLTHAAQRSRCLPCELWFCRMAWNSIHLLCLWLTTLLHCKVWECLDPFGLLLKALGNARNRSLVWETRQHMSTWNWMNLPWDGRCNVVGDRRFFYLASWGCPFPVHHDYNIIFIFVQPSWFAFAFWLSAVFLAIQEIWKYEIWFAFIFNIWSFNWPTIKARKLYQN